MRTVSTPLTQRRSDGSGRSERVVGEAARRIGREKVKIISKVFKPSMAHDKMVKACEDSLSRLGTDYLDVYFLHYPIPEEEVSIQERMETMTELKKAGKIRAIGLSNFSLEEMKAAMEYGQVDVIQPCYSLLWRYDEELLKFSRENDIAVIPYSTLAQGLLTEDPLLGSVAAVSAGIVDDQLLLDLCYEEDSAAQVDLNCVMTDRGQLVEIQGTGEGRAFTIQEQRQLVDLCAKGIDELLAKQREALAGKGSMPHVLVMSATPIPRTLAIILYGDLDISVVDELPASRLPIKNCVVDTGYRKTACRFMKQQVKAGRQCYVICPMVEESEALEAENVTDYARMLAEEMGPDICVRELHGRMKQEQKDEIMEAFGRGEIQILVSTTVIEVGIDVPNATVMMVENAERFGLAQLHQLRGRVGRGQYQSYCIFMSGSRSKEDEKRLEILNSSE